MGMFTNDFNVNVPLNTCLKQHYCKDNLPLFAPPRMMYEKLSVYMYLINVFNEVHLLSNSSKVLGPEESREFGLTEPVHLISYFIVVVEKRRVHAFHFTSFLG